MLPNFTQFFKFQHFQLRTSLKKNQKFRLQNVLTCRLQNLIVEPKTTLSRTLEFDYANRLGSC